MELDAGTGSSWARAASAVSGIGEIALASVIPLLSHCCATAEHLNNLQVDSCYPGPRCIPFHTSSSTRGGSVLGEGSE